MKLADLFSLLGNPVAALHSFLFPAAPPNQRTVFRLRIAAEGCRFRYSVSTVKEMSLSSHYLWRLRPSDGCVIVTIEKDMGVMLSGDLLLRWEDGWRVRNTQGEQPVGEGALRSLGEHPSITVSFTPEAPSFS